MSLKSHKNQHTNTTKGERKKREKKDTLLLGFILTYTLNTVPGIPLGAGLKLHSPGL
jgi:hypothetical protein